jgi:hypothetical protein
MAGNRIAMTVHKQVPQRVGCKPISLNVQCGAATPSLKRTNGIKLRNLFYTPTSDGRE